MGRLALQNMESWNIAQVGAVSHLSSSGCSITGMFVMVEGGTQGITRADKNQTENRRKSTYRSAA